MDIMEHYYLMEMERGEKTAACQVDTSRVLAVLAASAAASRGAAIKPLWLC